jgi:integrase
MVRRSVSLSATSRTPSMRYLATREDKLPWVFISEREAQLTRQAVYLFVRVAGEIAKLGRVWPHILRRSCGYYLAGDRVLERQRALQALDPQPDRLTSSWLRRIEIASDTHGPRSFHDHAKQ